MPDRTYPINFVYLDVGLCPRSVVEPGVESYPLNVRAPEQNMLGASDLVQAVRTEYANVLIFIEGKDHELAVEHLEHGRPDHVEPVVAIIQRYFLSKTAEQRIQLRLNGSAFEVGGSGFVVVEDLVGKKSTRSVKSSSASLHQYM